MAVPIRLVTLAPWSTDKRPIWTCLLSMYDGTLNVKTISHPHQPRDSEGLDNLKKMNGGAWEDGKLKDLDENPMGLPVRLWHSEVGCIAVFDHV